MSENHSVAEANKLLRVLNGQRRKYTVRVNLPDGKVVEFQSDTTPQLKYDDEARELWLQSSYSVPCMAWVEGAILLVEENPKP